MKIVSIFISFFLLCDIASASESKGPLIVASINPIYQIILAITQDKDNTVLIINPAISEHNYNLKKSDIQFISKADLIFYVSDELEYGFVKFINSYDKKSNAYELIKISDIKLLQKRNDIQKHDTHIWLNPNNAVVIAEFITQKIIEIDSNNKLKYQRNLTQFKKEVLASAKLIKKNLIKIKGDNYAFYRDEYHYFEDFFNIKPLKIIAKNHDYNLTARDLEDIDYLVKERGLKCIFGGLQDENNSAIKLAKNYKIKFSTLDVIGVGGYNNENGYSDLLKNISKDMISCF